MPVFIKAILVCLNSTEWGRVIKGHRLANYWLINHKCGQNLILQPKDAEN